MINPEQPEASPSKEDLYITQKCILRSPKEEAAEKLTRLGKWILCCQGCPETKSDCSYCKCLLYSSRVYKSAYGYARSDFYDFRRHDLGSRSEHCIVVGAAKLCCLYLMLSTFCCCSACKDNKCYGCGKKKARSRCRPRFTTDCRGSGSSSSGQSDCLTWACFCCILLTCGED